MRPKKLDFFIIKSFLLLFAAAFFICLFVLLMNILWRYAEDIIGKGLDFPFLIRFFYQFSLTLVPQALPLAVLMASLISFGNLGERLELLAMKTSGISLLRIMRPLIFFSLFLAGVSFYFQNVTVPHATQKLYSLIYTIDQKNPELEIPEGVFCNNVEGFNMYVKHKDFNTGQLYDVTIYDHRDGYENLSVIVADSAYLETTADKRHMYLHLFSGEQFCQEKDMDRKGKPYRRESFREKHILLEFDSEMKEAPVGFMSNKAASKNMFEIKHSIDSLSHLQDSLGLGNLGEYRHAALSTYRLQKADSAAFYNLGVTKISVDSTFAVASRSRQTEIKSTMRSQMQAQANDLAIKGSNMFYGDRSIRLHWIEWMKKVTNSLSILVFFFIGAPLGAIIRKGGLGVPVIISVLTFILFYITSVSGEKMFREGEWSIVGCWFSTIVLAPLSIFFTIKANSDSTIFQFDVVTEFFRHWFGTKATRNIIRKDVVIDDPDYDRCLKELSILKDKSVQMGDSELLNSIPNYWKLLTGTVDSSQLRELNTDLESLVTELGNSRDRIELDFINAFPIVPVYGVEAPFEKQWANKTVFILLPLGLLFALRAWLFGRKIKRQLTKIEQVSVQLTDYIENNKQQK
ncbi:MAG: LptF/LptG family permease [Bacteroidaceae bacterium]|nr:LptF/LptG family permease [Bacteroidaceae bacterium]